MTSSMWSAIITTGVFLAVLVPFSNGIRAVISAWSATRRVGPEELRRGQSDRPGGAEPLAILMVRILQKSLRENEHEGQPSDFVFDASRQYVMNEYEHNYARLISMYANLLPPLGFVGTTGGMLINFLSMHTKDEGLEVISLALALSSSFFALFSFAMLDALKLRLYSRLLAATRDVQVLYNKAESRRDQPTVDRPIVPKGARAGA
ncbi:MAG: hypothetical protein U0900_21970 [Myxococcota bacterium]